MVHFLDCLLSAAGSNKLGRLAEILKPSIISILHQNIVDLSKKIADYYIFPCKKHSKLKWMQNANQNGDAKKNLG